MLSPSIRADLEAALSASLLGLRVADETGLPVALRWPLADLGQALAYLAQKSALAVAPDHQPQPTAAGMAPLPSHPGAADDDALSDWIGLLAEQWGLEAEPVQSTYSEVALYLSAAGPALLKVTDETDATACYFIALLQGGRRRSHLIARDGSVQRVRHALVEEALWTAATSNHAPSIAQLVEKTGIAAARRRQVERTLLQELLGTTVQRAGWLLRLPPSAPLWQQAQQAGLLRTGAALIGGYLAQLLLTVAAWWMIGHGALAGHFDWGWLLGWALLLLTTVPFQAWVNLAQSELAIGMGAIFKQRLLHGVLQLAPEAIRHQGAGHFLGRVMASDTVEQLGLAGGFVALLALFQLGSAVIILALGIGGWLHGLLLLIWVGVTIGLGWRYWQRSHTWTATYRAMTNDLVERMVGHRTRLAQEDRQQWHVAEDQVLAHYTHLQRQLDQVESRLKALVPRGWMVLGIGGLVYALLFTQPSAAQIALTLGGILFAYQALSTIVLGLKSIVGARLAWQEVGELFQASTSAHRGPARRALLPTPANTATTATTTTSTTGAPATLPLLTIRDVDFRYRAEGRPVLQGCTLQIQHGDRLLLEGPSGGGKSTLAGILAGLRSPAAGLLLLRENDQPRLGVAAWRRQVVVVPQFHENYVLTGTFAFNLLMGRGWPPRPADLAAAEAICRELGLGELIDRMPAGLQQMVGESGWQLSHGERSRLYIARALLQNADLLILDESFAALDPENLDRALQAVTQHAPTLLVIAHP